MFQRFVINVQGDYEEDDLEGRPHLVVPAVILVDDIAIEGSEGSYLYPSDENEKSASDWDGQPITVYHPKENGRFVSAKHPTFFNTRKVGTIFNTVHEDGKVKIKCWFDKERTKEVDKRIYNAILKKKPMELSTGLDADVDVNEGSDKNGKKYKGKLKNYKPNHLAILPDKIGALSIAMGGGLFANAAQEPESVCESLSRSVTNVLKSIGVEILANELSFSDVTVQLNGLLASTYGEKGKYWGGYICEVFPTYVVFCSSSYDRGLAGKLFKVEYSVKDEVVSLSGTASEVVRTTEYTAKSVSNESPKENEEMFDKKAHVTALIANGQIEESDRVVFEALDEKVLKSMKVIQKQLAPTPAVIPPITTPAPTPVVNQSPLSVEDWKKIAPPSVVAVFNQGEKALQQVRDAYIVTIEANKGNKFKKEVLANMDLDTLAGIAEVARGQVESPADSQFNDGWQPNHGASFGGQMGYIPPITNQSEMEAPPEPPDMEFDEPATNLPAHSKKKGKKVAAE